MKSPELPTPKTDPSTKESAFLRVTNWLRHECTLVYAASHGQVTRLFRMAIGAKDGLALKTKLKAANRALGSKLDSLSLGDSSIRTELSSVHQSLMRFQTGQDGVTQTQQNLLLAKQADLHIRLATEFLSSNPAIISAVQDEVSAVRHLTSATCEHEVTMGQCKKSLFALDTATNVRAAVGITSIALLSLLLFKGLLHKQSLTPFAPRISSQQARETDFQGIMNAERQRAERERADREKETERAKLGKLAQIKAIVRRGDELRIAGKLQEAVATYRSAFAIEPESAFAFDGQGQVMMMLQQWRDAIPFFDKASQKDRTLPSPIQNRARCFIVLGDYRRAVTDLNHAIQIDPMNAECFSLRAHAYRELKDFPSALRDVETALKIDSRLADPYFNRGCILSVNPETSEDAIASLTTAIRHDPAHAMSYYFRGVIFLKQKELQKAIRDFSSAIEADQNLIDAHSSRGFVNAMTGDHQQAVKDFTTVLQKTSAADAVARLLLARGESHNALNQFSEAEKDFDRVLEIKPTSLEALQNRLVAKKGLGDSTGVREDTERIASLTRKVAPSFPISRGFSNEQPLVGGYANTQNSDYYMQRAVQQSQEASQQLLNRFRNQRAGSLAAMGVYFD